VKSNAVSYDVQSQQKLWTLSEQLVKAHAKAA
jgi:hypothetical protein